MKSGSNILAKWMLAIIILLSLRCYSTCGYASDNRRSTRDILERIDSLENPKTIEAKQPDRVLEVLGIKPGDVVADVGCGTGTFTFRLADMVGKDGKVYAVDILDYMLDYVGTKMKKENVTNIAIVKSSDSDPHLPAMCCDKIILFNTYHHIVNKDSFFSKLHKSLKESGTVAIIGPAPIKSSFNKNKREEKVIREMEKLGFKFKVKYDFIVDRYFVVFTLDH